jgi:transcription initiation factor TFIIB
MRVITNKSNTICPSCKSDSVLYDKTTGEQICQKCGYVIESDMIDYGREWRSFEDERDEGKGRMGSPLSYAKYDKGTSTVIGKASESIKLSNVNRRTFYKLRKWQPRISTAFERNLKFALTELRHASNQLHVSSVIQEEAAKMYREAINLRLVRGRSMESVIAGALYAAARKYSRPITLDEISETFGVERKEVGKAYRLLCRELGIKILPTSPHDYVYKIAATLSVSNSTVSDAISLLKEAEGKGLTSGKGPIGIAAAVIYIGTLINSEKKTQRDVAKAAGITEVTIRNRYKELYDALHLKDRYKIEE